MDGLSFLLDTNILLRWLEPSDPDHLIVKTAVDKLILSNTACATRHRTFGEFWNACTRPILRNGFGLHRSEADQGARRFESRLTLLPDTIEVHRIWRRMLVDYGISGIQVHGVKQILTFNARDFRRFAGIKAVLPQDLAASEPAHPE
jgi:predicted nucleic acid-binding protein